MSAGLIPAYYRADVGGTMLEKVSGVSSKILDTSERHKMNTLKGWITTFCLVVALAVSTVPVFAEGVIIGGRSITDTQTQTQCTMTDTKEKMDWGVIIGGFTGVIIGGFTGVIIGGALDTPVDCGVIIGG
jgi:hypothetical protein